MKKRNTPTATAGDAAAAAAAAMARQGQAVGVQKKKAPQAAATNGAAGQKPALLATKKEPIDAPTPTRGNPSRDLGIELPTAKKPRTREPATPASEAMQLQMTQPQSGATPAQQQAVAAAADRAAATALASPAPVQGAAAGTVTPRSITRGRTPRASDSVVWALSAVRVHLQSMTDVEGVREALELFPECVLVGGIAARRELVAALLGEHGIAPQLAATLVAPGMRQPLALELRSGAEDAKDLSALSDQEAKAFLAQESQRASQGLGNKLKAEPLRMRLSIVQCTNLDIVELPERMPAANGAVPPKLEEIRQKYLGSESNLLVCVEPGTHLELCRRFDPQLKRTMLIGAAASAADGNGGQLSAAERCGAAAARNLEERFASMCRDRVPQWLSALERMEIRIQRAQLEAKEAEKQEDAEEVLRRARDAGACFGRALQHIISGAPGCDAGAHTLEEELAEFMSACQKGQCGVGDILSAADAAEAAHDLFGYFGSAQKYATYLRDKVHVRCADVPLNGGAALQRLLPEIEVALLLAHPSQEDLADLALSAIRAGGTGVHGHQRWEDVSSKLMLSVAMQPLRRRIRYVVARVAWMLRQQKKAVSEWMANFSELPVTMYYSLLSPQHLAVLRSNKIARDLVFDAFNNVAVRAAADLMKTLEGTLMAGCINPQVMLRPHTEPDIDPTQPGANSKDKGQAKQRVKAELRNRNSSKVVLPVHLRDRVFEPGQVESTLPHVEMRLRKGFSFLATVLGQQAYAFADRTVKALCGRDIELAMSAIDFGPDQRRALNDRHNELQNTAKQMDDRLMKVKRCIAALRSVSGSMGPLF